jgi:hypothetical protein
MDDLGTKRARAGCGEAWLLNVHEWKKSVTNVFRIARGLGITGHKRERNPL